MNSWFVTRMRMDLQLLRLLGAAIVMIAVYAMPSAALAHESHEAVAVSVAASEDTSATTSSLPAEAAELASEEASPEVPCNAGCCSGGSSCCAPAISDASHNMDLPPGGQRIVLAPASVFGGVDSNAFRRPPKAFV